MPHATPGQHPFDATFRDCAPNVLRIDIADGAFGDVRQRGDARMGVEARRERRALMVEEVEKHERLQDLAEIGRAHQTCGEALRSTMGTLHDSPGEVRRR